MPARRSSRFEADSPHGLGLKLGDTVTVNVLGRNIDGDDRQSARRRMAILGINFVMVFSPDTFAGAPHTDLATLTFADGGTHAGGNRAHPGRWPTPFPTVTAVRVKDALERIDALVGKLALAIRGASAIALIAASPGARRRARGRPAPASTTPWC